MKRSQFRIKLYELTISTGITLDFMTYCGKGLFHEHDQHSDMPTSERIPINLMQSFLGKGHILFTDNYYISY